MEFLGRLRRSFLNWLKACRDDLETPGWPGGGIVVMVVMVAVPVAVGLAVGLVALLVWSFFWAAIVLFQRETKAAVVFVLWLIGLVTLVSWIWWNHHKRGHHR